MLRAGVLGKWQAEMLLDTSGIADISAKIQTEGLLNKSPKRYYCSNPPCLFLVLNFLFCAVKSQPTV